MFYLHQLVTSGNYKNTSKQWAYGMFTYVYHLLTRFRIEQNKDIHIMFAQTNWVKEISPWPIGSSQDLSGSHGQFLWTPWKV